MITLPRGWCQMGDSKRVAHHVGQHRWRRFRDASGGEHRVLEAFTLCRPPDSPTLGEYGWQTGIHDCATAGQPTAGQPTPDHRCGRVALRPAPPNLARCKHCLRMLTKGESTSRRERAK